MCSSADEHIELLETPCSWPFSAPGVHGREIDGPRFLSNRAAVSCHQRDKMALHARIQSSREGGGLECRFMIGNELTRTCFIIFIRCGREAFAGNLTTGCSPRGTPHWSNSIPAA